MGKSKTYFAGTINAADVSDNGPHVDYVRPEVEAMSEDWQTIEDCLDGERSIKGCRREKYLPRPDIYAEYGMRPRPRSENPLDVAAWNNAQSANAGIEKLKYDDYLERALYLNVPRQTLDAMVGEVFKHKVKVNLPESLNFLINDVDGRGVSLEQQLKGSVEALASTSRHGLLVDYPRSAGGIVSKADLNSGKVRATITDYNCWSIINWDHTRVGGLEVPSLVMLREQYVDEAQSDRYVKVYAEQIRELSLEEWAEGMSEPIYIQRIWRKAKGKDGKEYWKQYGDDIVPLDYEGKPFDHIPFHISGAQENDWKIDRPVLRDLCKLTIYHYRNSADLEWNAHNYGSPTKVVTGMTQDDYEDMGGVLPWASATKAILLGSTDAKVELVQASPNTLLLELMKLKERNFLTMGAKIATQQTVRKTATETELDALGGTCVLVSCVVNTNATYNAALKDVGLFHGVEVADNAIEISKEIVMTSFDAQQLLAIATGIDTTLILRREGREKAIELGLANVPFDEYLKELKKEQQMLKSVVTTNSTAGGGGVDQEVKTMAARSENAI